MPEKEGNNVRADTETSFPTAAGRHARLHRSADLRGVCLTTLIALVAQFVVGMFLNLYVAVPSSDAHAGHVQEILNGPVSLTVHVLLGTVVICAAVLLLIRAIVGGNRTLANLAATTDRRAIYVKRVRAHSYGGQTDHGGRYGSCDAFAGIGVRQLATSVSCVPKRVFGTLSRRLGVGGLS